MNFMAKMFSIICMAVLCLKSCCVLGQTYIRDSELLDALLANYDNRLPPSYPSPSASSSSSATISSYSPVEVRARVVVNALVSVCEQCQTCTFDITLHQQWTDSRLAFSPALLDFNRGYVVIEANSQNKNLIWTPPRWQFTTSVPTTSDADDEKHRANPQQASAPVVTVFANGTVKLSERKLHVVKCKLNYKQFPSDETNLTLQLTAPDNATSGAQLVSFPVLNHENENDILASPSSSLIESLAYQFRVVELRRHEQQHRYNFNDDDDATQSQSSSYIVQLKLIRQAQIYCWILYAPTLALSLVGWIFLLWRRDTQQRQQQRSPRFRLVTHDTTTTTTAQSPLPPALQGNNNTQHNYYGRCAAAATTARARPPSTDARRDRLILHCLVILLTAGTVAYALQSTPATPYVKAVHVWLLGVFVFEFCVLLYGATRVLDDNCYEEDDGGNTTEAAENQAATNINYCLEAAENNTIINKSGNLFVRKNQQQEPPLKLTATQRVAPCQASPVLLQHDEDHYVLVENGTTNGNGVTGSGISVEETSAEPLISREQRVSGSSTTRGGHHSSTILVRRNDKKSHKRHSRRRWRKCLAVLGAIVLLTTYAAFVAGYAFCMHARIIT